MKIFENLQEYTTWFVLEATGFDANEMMIVNVKSIHKLICVCGSPQAIEDVAERSVQNFFTEWNLCAPVECRLNEDADSDLVSMMRDNLLETFEKYKNMEIVYVSTEY